MLPDIETVGAYEHDVLLYTQHAANNDVNGNPRRVFVFRAISRYENVDPRVDYYGNDGYTHIVATVDEGYAGDHGARKAVRDHGFQGPLINNGRVECSVYDYRRYLRWPKP